MIAEPILCQPEEATNSDVPTSSLPCQDIDDTGVNSKLFMKELGIEMVNLYADPKPTRIQVQKRKLCARIPYFDKMFKSGCKEALENCATFPDDEPETFDLLMEWAYTGVFRSSDYGPCACSDESTCTAHPRYPIEKFYTLADHFCLLQLQDQIMDEICRFHDAHEKMDKLEFMNER
jgi:hypothetical protein